MSNAEPIPPFDSPSPEKLQLVEPSDDHVATTATTGLLRANLPIVCSVVSTLCFALSFLARRRKMRARGVLFSLLGTAAASAGGYFGRASAARS